MDFYNRWVKKIEEVNPYNTIGTLKTELKALQVSTTQKARPYRIVQEWRSMMPEHTVEYLYNLANSSRPYKFAIKAIRDEIHRKLPEWEPRFKSKCLHCGREYQIDRKKCDCKSEHLRGPDWSQLDNFVRDDGDNKGIDFIEMANETQSLIEVCKMISLDLDTVDEGWLIVLKEYITDLETGAIIGWKPKEIRRGNPRVMRYIHDQGGYLGDDIWICLHHRGWQQKGETCKVKLDDGKVCGCKLFQAKYAAIGRGSGGDKHGAGTDLYYIDGEVINWQKHNPDELYSQIPPIIELFFEVFSHLWGSHNMKNFYENDWMAGFFTANTSNPDSLYKFWEQIKDKLKYNKYEPTILPFESKDGRGKVEFHGVSDIFKEANHAEFRKEMERVIAIHFGVSNIYRGDASVGAGLNNEGHQLTVTVRAAETSQWGYNNKGFPFMARQFHITDFRLILPPIEETDEAAEVQLRISKDTEARGKLAMGYVGKLDADKEWQYIRDFEEADRILSLGAGVTPDSQISDPLNLGGSVTGGGVRLDGSPPPIKVISFKGIDELDQMTMHTLEDTQDSKAFLDPRKALILEALEKGALWKSIAGLKARDVKALHDLIFEKMTQPQGWSVNSIMEDITKRFTGIDLGNAKNIVRTETTELMNTARALSYEDTDTPKQRYKWIGVNDIFTTDICKGITKEVGSGKPLKELKAIIHKWAKANVKNGGTPERTYTPHYGCRRTLVRTLGGKAEKFLAAIEDGDQSFTRGVLSAYKGGKTVNSICTDMRTDSRRVNEILRKAL